MGRKRINLKGQKNGKLTAIAPDNTRSRKNRTYWWFECDCGEWIIVRADSFKSGGTKSCGCSRHGMSDALIYGIWSAMIQRCENPKDPGYKYYGGRGIKVCKRWHDFRNFYADVGDPPKGMTLDRWPDNDGDYKLNNFRWASHHEQVNNRRPNSSGRVKQRWFRAWHKDSMAQFMSNNQHAFARKFDLNNTNISNCLCDRQKTHKGWTFKRI